MHEFPEKERRAVRIAEPTVDERIRESVTRVAQRRAPWFSAAVKTVTWCTEVVFEPGLARSFGRDRCWLVGDAAHQTGPAGVQSMNSGFREGKKLAELFSQVLRQDAPLNSLAQYDREQAAQWRQLLGMTGGLISTPNPDPWVNSHRARLLACLPGTGTDVVGLARALNLNLA